MEMHLFLFLYLGFFIREGIAQTGNVTVCGNEEEYQECGSCERICGNRKETCKTPCYAGCFCKSGLLRARDRSCVQPKDCNRPSCKDNEEYYDCGSQCPLTCKNYQEPIFCTKQCTKGCFCKPGYVTGPGGKCILPRDCPVGPCRENEHTTDCVSPCNTCAQRGKCDYEYCDKGCDCKPGFFKNSTGCCVPPTKCDVQESTCPKNEHYVSCTNVCNDCWSRGDCEQSFCHPGCDCLPGHFRDDNEECVPESQCKTEGSNCGVNEEYSECAGPCNDCKSRGNCHYECEYGCDCKRGYFRDAKGVCIPASQCPGEKGGIEPRGCRTCGYKCPVGEEYYICKPTCKKTCDTYYSQDGTECQKECQPGCACKEGLVKNREGACVYPQQCPQVCRDNEEYTECGSPCPETCNTRGQKMVCAAYCVKGCFCRKGFVRGPDGRCVSPDKCPLVCGLNEEFLQCGSPCPLTCMNRTVSRLCPKICVHGCVCKPGYIRSATGACILPNECPVVCSKNEIFLECGSACQKTCENTGKVSERCLLPCSKGCFCRTGYVRGPDGKCILPQQCPVVCSENEIFLECGSTCQKTCENTGKVSERCLLHCSKGCFCRTGYVRGPDGKCILPQQCPVVCQEYEAYLECGPACQRTCDNATKGPCALPCRKGCFCQPGYVRGPNGKCILPQHCPLVCQEHEIFLECGTACEGTCENTTIDQCTLPCRKGCFCQPGYIRGPNRKCILPQQCPVVCQEYEIFLECGTACERTCDNTTIDQCTLPCRKGCFCQPGYIRGPNGKCILPQQCPVVCEDNEVFLECGSACQGTCNNIVKRTSPCPTTCSRGCFCKPGYIRGPSGKCILPEQCPVVCEENEVWTSLTCSHMCIDTCENIGKAPGNCPLTCIKGCFCKPGYIRGPNGKCILPQQCPVVCQEHEIFLECGTACEGTCENTTIDQCALPCRKGCFCRPGYIRGPNRKCIPPQQCPVVCQENEVFLECGSACQGTCNNVGNPASLCPNKCTRGCFCKPGYIRGPYGKCILPEQCPVVCQENEVFLECGSPCQDTCENIGKALVRCPLTCIKGCFCKPGYIRGPGGKCILPNQCPLVCQGNEVLLTCGKPCQRTCNDIGKAEGPCVLPCIKGCFCKPGYVRGPTGNCILPTKCPVVCGENEEFKKCGKACPATCLNRTTANACTSPCIDGCSCKPGFVRGPDWKCIIPTSCPVVCEQNEEFQKCGTACPTTCSNRATSYACALPCVEGCFCKPGFIRGPNGKCILPTLCPVVCGQNEEFQKCGTACPTTCSNRATTYACTLPCLEGCFCKPGFIRGPNGKCILPTLCPVVCGENEEFQKCGTACPTTCSNRATNYACTLPCIEGCTCKPGFLRGPDGKCILPTSCPVVCGENEEFQKCGTACPTTCSNRGTTHACTLQCVEGCFCKPGFIRGPNGKCILPTSCPVVCGENEQFFECRSPCQKTCENRNSVINCKFPCLTGCFCKPGFVRDANGKCIDPRSCPTGPCTKENEIYNPCGPACIKTCARFEYRSQCPQRCVRGCFCKDGFVRDLNSNCIRFENCPKEPQMCPTGESFYACKPTCRDTCQTLDFQGPCDDLCRPGCACRGGLVRDTINDRCVSPRDCSSMIDGRRGGTEPEHITTTMNPKTVTTVDTGSQKTVTTTPSNPVTQTEAIQTKQPVTTVKSPLTTRKETMAPTVITTHKPGTTLKSHITTLFSPATKNPVTVGKTLKPVDTTSMKSVVTTTIKPVVTTLKKPVVTTPTPPIVATTSKQIVTTPSKPTETTIIVPK